MTRLPEASSAGAPVAINEFTIDAPGAAEPPPPANAQPPALAVAA